MDMLFFLTSVLVTMFGPYCDRETHINFLFINKKLTEQKFLDQSVNYSMVYINRHPHGIPYDVWKHIKLIRFGVRSIPILDIDKLPVGLIQLHYNRCMIPQTPFGDLPGSLKRLRMSYDHNKPMISGVFPIGLEELFLSHFNQKLIIGFLPHRLSRLSLGSDFNQRIGFGVLPDTLIKLNLGLHFNHPIEPGVLPKGLLTLNLGFRFNHPIEPGVLPKGLVKMYLPHVFNQPIEPGVLPDTLIKLNLGTYFNRPLKVDVLPKGLVKLNLGHDFNQPIEPGVLPDTLINLNLGIEFNCPIGINVLPASLEKLTFGPCFRHQIGIGVLPAGLLTLKIGDYYDNFTQFFDVSMLSPELKLSKWKKSLH